jgi:phosphate:Na+ symporter
MQRMAGKRLRRLLERLTCSPARGVLVGLAVTAVLQSSSATTVMVVGLVDAGLLRLREAIGVILGANIGTTVTAQLVALDLDYVVIPAGAVGLVLLEAGRQEGARNLGRLLVGLGLIFGGLGIMSRNLVGLSQNAFFLSLLTNLGRRPPAAIAAAALVTGVMQSSSAVTGMIIALADAGLLQLPEAVALVLGSNIGTTATALLAGLAAGVNGRRAALVHLLFNVLGVTVLMPFLPQFVRLVAFTSPDLARQIANAHTLFNLMSVALFLPWVGVLEHLAIALLPGF